MLIDRKRKKERIRKDTECLAEGGGLSVAGQLARCRVGPVTHTHTHTELS